MIDGNNSVEEDTELRDLVVQTLENNGVLAKVRAELRASVFLALEEQESVMNPVPLLNKTVKQYLASSEGKLLFSLVREFLEYFGLDFTMSVYDPETYFGKEYKYAGRNKLCEELGISSSEEPLLGKILKNTIVNGAFNNAQKKDSSNSRLEKSLESSNHFSNSTFEVSVPKVLRNSDEMTSLSNDIQLSEVEDESASESVPQIPINVTITGKKSKADKSKVEGTETLIRNVQKEASLRDKERSLDLDEDDESIATDIKSESSNTETGVDAGMNMSESLIKFDESIVQEQTNQNEDKPKQKTRSEELQMTNSRNSLVKSVFFDEIIVDGRKEKVDNVHKSESLLPPLTPKTNSIFSNFPPLNGKKTNIDDLKKLVEIATDGIDNYDEDFSYASGSASEQSPSKEAEISDSPRKSSTMKEESTKSLLQSEEMDDVDDVNCGSPCLDSVAVGKVL